VLAALVASYGYVLEAERAVHELSVRVTELERVAYRDALTGLLNRRAWDEAVLREQARCLRQPRAVAIVVVDLDELKAVNDEHGHLAGDVLLRLTGGVLREILRPSDVVARIGGDEFAAMVVDAADEAPGSIAERIRRDLAGEGIGASVGAALSPDRGKTPPSAARG
jgi:diguanylate cyclase (GGDEF)-like protein